MQPTLLILAAGMGSRYGGIKQLDQFGPNGETLMDYSLFDAYRAGFRKVVFIIREELRSDFMERFEKNLEGKLVIDYAIQSLNAYVPDALGEIHRLKPWGTGHAYSTGRFLQDFDNKPVATSANDKHVPKRLPR